MELLYCTAYAHFSSCTTKFRKEGTRGYPPHQFGVANDDTLHPKKDPAAAQIDCAAGTHGVVLADGEILGAAGGSPTGSEEGRSMDDVEEEMASAADCDSISVAFVKH